jgi:hypothetical protein
MTEPNCSASSAHESSKVEQPKKLWHRPEVRLSSVPGATARAPHSDGFDGPQFCHS